MKPGSPEGDTVYVVALTLQTDTSNGVFTRHRVGWAGVPKQQRYTTELAIASLRRQVGMESPDYRVIAHYVGLANPFDAPTRCLVSITTMPGGIGFAARLRQRRREYTISQYFTLVDAFVDLVNEEESDSIIGWSVTPVELPS